MQHFNEENDNQKWYEKADDWLLDFLNDKNSDAEKTMTLVFLAFFTLFSEGKSSIENSIMATHDHKQTKSTWSETLLFQPLFFLL